MKGISFILILLFLNVEIQAYETPTHDALSASAVNNSILRLEPSFLTSLGLELETGIDEQFFPSKLPQNVDDANDPYLKSRASILEIIRGGAVLEDSSVRSVNHFYDIQHGGLPSNYYGFTVPRRARSSADWILEIGVGEEELDIKGQNFSYNDALGHFYLALTEETESARKTSFSSTFKSLGHVIHHIQDMAQPQHVRNDAHCDATTDLLGWPLVCLLLGLHNPSHYEKYTNRPEVRKVLPFDFNAVGLSIPEVSTVREFWTNTRNEGLAQFTSTNFVSQGKNFQLDEEGGVLNNAEFPLPVPEQGLTFSESLGVLLFDGIEDIESVEAQEAVAVLNRLDCAPQGSDDCQVQFIRNTVTDDRINSITINERAASVSIFDDELTSRDLEVTYVVGGNTIFQPKRLPVMHRFNFVSGYKFLIPRAVAYSAGLINHFFRGRLEIEDVVVTGNQMEITVKNVSKNDQALESGTFELYYDDTNDLRQEITGVTILEGTLPLVVDDTIKLTANFPADLNTDKEKPFMLVFNAKEEGNAIGQERGVAAINFTAEKEGGSFLVYPYYTPDDGIDGQRLVSGNGNDWEASLYPDGEAGNVDWKGKYVGGKPTKILTWWGEESRYFNDGRIRRRTSIYKEGAQFSNMPCGVIGAAIREHDGQEWIIGVCANAGNLEVYERLNTYNLSNALYDPDTAPEGWHQLGSFPIVAKNPIPTWFFNGDGTEAQSLVKVLTGEPSPFDTRLDRMKLTLTGQEASLENLGNLEGITLTDSCSGSCTGSGGGTQCSTNEDNFFHVERRDVVVNGSYIVAVDYKDNEEVLATIVADELFRIDRNYTSDTDSSTFLYDESHTGDYSRLEYGENSLILQSVDGSFIDYNVDDGNHSYNERHIYEDGGLSYLDLRNGVYFKDRELIDNTFVGDNASGNYTETKTELYQVTALANDGTTNITLPTLDEASGTFPSNRRKPTPNTSSVCDSYSERRIFVDYPSVEENTFSGGYIATDLNGNVAFGYYSQAFYSDNAQFLNKIGNTELLEIFPGVSDFPEYEIYVVE